MEKREAAKKRRVMLSIVSQTYDDPQISSLDHAKESAEVFERFFTEELPEDERFELIPLVNPSAGECSRIFDRIVENYGADTTLLILWTGHGILSARGSEHLFLCRDADWTVKKGKSEVGVVPDGLVKTKLARFLGDVVEIQDDCRSEPDAYRSGVYKVNYVRKQRKNLRRDPSAVKSSGGKKNVRKGRRFHLWACNDGQSTGDDSRFAKLFVATARERLARTGALVMNDSFVEALCENAAFEDQTPVSGGAPIALVGDLPFGPEGDDWGGTVGKTPDAPWRPLAVLAVIVVAAVASLYAYLNRVAYVSEPKKPVVQTPNITGTETTSSPAATPGGSETTPNDLKTHVAQTSENSKIADELQTAWTALDDGKLSDAEKIASEVLKKAPENADAKELLARVRTKEGEASRKSGELDEAESKAKEASGDDSDCQAAKDLQSRIAADRRKEQERRDGVWAESLTRKAGTRQTLEIGNAEYGFVWIPAGEFDMGSPTSEEDRSDDETLHHVRLTKGFWMLETETTQALYQEVMGKNPSKFKGDNFPVEFVSWDDAVEFCAELTKRLSRGMKASLPTEAQWEYACRAGTKTAYYYGKSFDSSKMNYNYVVGKTSQLKSYKANPWGLFDMHGNVWEWCLDYYAEDYPAGIVIDPEESKSASFRVERGGSWDHGARYCRSAYRSGFSADAQGDYLGFRFVLICD